MKLYANPTSPFARVTCMVVREKGLADVVSVRMVDAWADTPDFLDANPAGRVPTLVTDEGVQLTETFLILHYLAAIRPEPVLVPWGPAGAAVLARVGLAFGVFDAAVAVVIGRKSAPGFDHDMVGRKRFRTMRTGLARLDAALPETRERPFDLADIAAVTALDYIGFRFPEIDWRGVAPRLAAFRDAQADRPSVCETAPRA